MSSTMRALRSEQNKNIQSRESTEEMIKKRLGQDESEVDDNQVSGMSGKIVATTYNVEGRL